MDLCLGVFSASSSLDLLLLLSADFAAGGAESFLRSGPDRFPAGLYFFLECLERDLEELLEEEEDDDDECLFLFFFGVGDLEESLEELEREDHTGVCIIFEDQNYSSHPLSVSSLKPKILLIFYLYHL